MGKRSSKKLSLILNIAFIFYFCHVNYHEFSDLKWQVLLSHCSVGQKAWLAPRFFHQQFTKPRSRCQPGAYCKVLKRISIQIHSGRGPVLDLVAIGLMSPFRQWLSARGQSLLLEAVCIPSHAFLGQPLQQWWVESLPPFGHLQQPSCHGSFTESLLLRTHAITLDFPR